MRLTFISESNRLRYRWTDPFELGSRMLRSHLRLLAALTFGLVSAVGLALVWREAVSVSEIKPPVQQVSNETPSAPAPDDWPWWRGTTMQNVSETMDIPTEWEEGRNVAWKEPLEGRGHASPVVRGGDVFVFAADEAVQEHFLACHDLATGKRKWKTIVNTGGFMAKHEKNSFASPTPICDGQSVFLVMAHNNAIHVVAVGLDGLIAWKAEVGPYVSEWGYGSSPVLYGNNVIVVADNRGSKLGRLKATSFLAALDRSSGDLVWRVRRPEERSYGVPLVADIAGRPQLVVAGPKSVESYDPRNGDTLWIFEISADRVANSLAYDEFGIIASFNQGGRETICIRADGSGDVTGTHAAWRSKSASCDVPSPLVVNGRVYVADDIGIVSCLKLLDGKQLWKVRVATTGVSSSPTAIGGNIFLADEAGEVHIFEDANEYTPVSVVKTGSPIFASPVVSGDRLLIRTAEHLWCIRTSDKLN